MHDLSSLFCLEVQWSVTFVNISFLLFDCSLKTSKFKGYTCAFDVKGSSLQFCTQATAKLGRDMLLF